MYRFLISFYYDIMMLGPRVHTANVVAECTDSVQEIESGAMPSI